MIAMDYIHRFRHTVGHLMRSKKRNEERLKKLQKIINFETLVQEVSDDKVKPEAAWPSQGKVSFN